MSDKPRLNMVIDKDVRDGIDSLNERGFSQRVIVQAGVRMLMALDDHKLIGALLEEMGRKNRDSE